MALTDQQARFAEEYIIDLNATQAAIRAGYSADTAYSQGSRLLRNVEVRARVVELMKARSEATLVDSFHVVQALLEVSQRCMQAQPVLEYDPEGGMVQKRDSEGNAIYEFDSNGANKALELLGKHLAMFTDKTQHSGEIGGDLPDDKFNKLLEAARAGAQTDTGK